MWHTHTHTCVYIEAFTRAQFLYIHYERIQVCARVRMHVIVRTPRCSDTCNLFNKVILVFRGDDLGQLVLNIFYLVIWHLSYLLSFVTKSYWINYIECYRLGISLSLPVLTAMYNAFIAFGKRHLKHRGLVVLQALWKILMKENSEIRILSLLKK